MTTGLLAMLQVAATLLMSIQNNPQATLATQQQAIATANHAIQLSVQSLATIPFAITPNLSPAPNILALENAAYLNSEGSWSRAGAGVELVASSTSFGDLNGDGVDDAAALVVLTPQNGTRESYALAAMVNQGKSLFNIADASLGSGPVAIYSHSIQNGELVLDMQIGNAPRATYRYALVGNSFKVW